MYRYILKRIGLAVFVLIGVSMLVYCLMELSPVDSVISVVGEDATEEEYRQEWLNQHLDKPVIYGANIYSILMVGWARIPPTPRL